MTQQHTAAAERPGLNDLTSEQIAPLERLFVGGFPDTWRDFARSLYLTLIALRGGNAKQLQQLQLLAEEAVELTKGIAVDMGGSQPYIPVGHLFASDAKAMRVVKGFTGNNYRELAVRENITESRVRQILAAWRKEQFAALQGRLDLAI